MTPPRLLPVRTFQQIGRLGRAHNPVIYADRGVIVINKPPGLVCQLQHPTKRRILRVAEGLDYDFNNLLEELRKVSPLGVRPYPVHRLDKGTTGALVLARSASLARELSQQFYNKSVEKTYLALVRGGSKSFNSRSGQITSSIQYSDGRASLDPSRDSKPSITDWELVDSSPIAPLSLLRLKLRTGHKHQLRVHVANCLNAPILGDTLYSKSPASDLIARLSTIPKDRIFLHASQISFFRYKAAGPNKRFRLGICAPLPEDFLTICTSSGLKVDPAEARGGLSIDGVFFGDSIPELDGYWVSKSNESLSRK